MTEGICRVGLIGAGTVGGGVIEILTERAELIKRRSGISVELTKVTSRTVGKIRAAGVADACIVNHYHDIIADESIDLIVELIGGLDPAEAIVRDALTAKKAVVTANKALLAERGRELFALAGEMRTPLFYEAAVAGGIPIILALREGLMVNRMQSLLGIVNGTCNYILSKMIGEGVEYADALREAQTLGYAEADPTFDVEGIDSGHKLALLSALAFETWVDFPALAIEGISRLNITDMTFAQELGYTVKLLAVARPNPAAKTLFLSVHPALLPRRHPLANVEGEMNAVEVVGDIAGAAMFYGHGAGKDPTASAVVADILTAARDRQNGAANVWVPKVEPHYHLAPMCDYETCYYLRFSVIDEPGVLGKITTAIGAHHTSIATVHQHMPTTPGTPIPVVVLTHKAREGNIHTALAEIQSLGFVKEPPVCIRVEG